jgi:hypothetical protein
VPLIFQILEHSWFCCVQTIPTQSHCCIHFQFSLVCFIGPLLHFTH